MKYLPFVIGLVTAALVDAAAGRAGLVCYLVGVFMGGWVPFYLMPWVMRRRR